MDPYCILKVRDDTWRTKVLDEAGKLPKWNETFDIPVKYVGDDLNIQVLDEDLTKSDLVGSANIKMTSLCCNGGMDDWFDIQYKGKKAGTVHLKGQWMPEVPENARMAVAGGMLGAFMGGHNMN
jgi:Ca2+-dependent lipid-binding protein